MRPDDVGDVSRVVVAAFKHSVAEHLSGAGVSTFMEIASKEALLKRMPENNTMLVYESVKGILGYAEVREGRHIAMLFVHPAEQHAGVGRQLIAEALRLCTSELVTVKASLSSVGAYLKYGFVISGGEDVSHGLRFRPMEKKQ